MLHKYVPAGLQDPVGLARRLLRTRDPDAMFALKAAAVALLVNIASESPSRAAHSGKGAS
jgi:hypothetical protein